VAVSHLRPNPLHFDDIWRPTENAHAHCRRRCKEKEGEGAKREDVGEEVEPEKWRKRLSQSSASREREGTKETIDTRTDGRNRLIKKIGSAWPYNIQRTCRIQLAYAFNLLCGFSDG